MTPTALKDTHNAEMQGSDAYELKPCPWCGGANITKVDDGESEWLICANCEATGPYSPDAYAADLSIEQAWNIRADLPPFPEAFQQMLEALERILKDMHDAEMRGSDASKLKPCPFCGGNAAIMGGPTAQERWAVWCENGHNMRGGASKEAAIAAWNTRVSPSPEAFQQMREALNRIQNWRDECHDYDRDMGHEPREFDDDDLVMVEAYARAALKAAEESK